MTSKKCADILLSHDNILILTHKNPDGDTIGSAAALCSCLRRAGKKAWLFPNYSVSYKLLPFCEKYFIRDNFEPKFFVSVDVAEKSLLVEGFEGKIDLCIDHHSGRKSFASQSYVMPEKAACGEIIAAIIKDINGNLTKEEADLLYIAVSTDTGCFKYANTNASTLRTVARLLENGADSFLINELFFRKMQLSKLKLEGKIYNSISMYRDGKIAIAIITRSMMDECGLSDNDMDDVASFVGRVEGTEIGITVRELENGDCKVSVRTGVEVDSSEICSAFGGGGHKGAAGCTISTAPEYAVEQLLAVIDEVWK